MDTGSCGQGANKTVAQNLVLQNTNALNCKHRCD